ncbi:dihydroxyacetone kinase subunit DhaL [Ligilactobacillus sp. LYQ135]
MNLTLDQFTKWMEIYQQKIKYNQDYLNDLDSQIGDGDHGSNMLRGMDVVVDDLKHKKDYDLTDALKITAMALITNVGGASGPLYGSAFLEMHKKSQDTTEIGELLDAATRGIQNRGNAKPDDKTMYDVWLLLTDAVKNNELTSKLIKQTVEHTKNLIAKKGRASYLGERSKGVLDPGTVSSGYLFEALLETEDL